MANTKTHETADSLQRAIDYLGAVEVAPGDKCAHRWIATDAFSVERECEICCTKDFAAKQALYAVKDGDSYLIHNVSHLRAMGANLEEYGNIFGRYLPTTKRKVVRMPAWWSPSQRFASFDGDTLKATGSSKTAATLCDTRAEAPIYGAPLPYRLITADLETGSEQPA